MDTMNADSASQPLWYKDAIIYQLHIKSFYDANGDGVGDFAGLHQKLDHIAALGVNAIWLLPFFPSPRRDDGYDIADYGSVSPDYGTVEDFRAFVDAAHQRNIRVIIELVINHTSDQHPWFQRAREAPAGSPERDFYVWSDTDQKFPETRIIFIDTEKSNWTWDAVAGAYYWHRFYSHQPDLNFDSPLVMEELLRVMRFWLETGIDGFRLDAIPYLVEREGTINENLPETHAILKRIRAALDATHPGVMLLAEANQWPEDTREYFGEGDECHMAFHFPLMPRMYMAIAKEDRFPIADILRQTPEIPDNCQWAIFLRNHDELTLEMVTDAERDYLWETYASDKRARINLGIRRRLAPLMERDRRRIELMNALLLSMPGTPVIYYGDEIGMGDNIYLGDRDGVRTPMQWSPDRNGGFSRADPARLVLPPVADPLYGFEAVNVEAQSTDAHSLLNWTRRMLALRGRHPAFGRGTLRFLSPENRKILAYLREYEGEVLLCVASLSRLPQAVELDLSSFEGRVPIELTGMSPFPPIGQLTYLLTLPPYGFFWFQLTADADPPAWRTAPPEQLPDLLTMVIRRSLLDLVDEPGHARILSGEILPAYLSRRRWFGAKDQPLQSARLVSATPIPFADGVVLGELEVVLPNHSESYQLPLTVAWDDAHPSALAQQLALGRIRQGRRVGFLTDGFAVEAMARGILHGLRDRSRTTGRTGTLEFLGTEQLDSLDISDELPVHWLSAEQSNSSLLVGDVAMIKLIRHIFPGIHPEVEMTRYLTRAGYDHTAPLLGEVAHTDSSGRRSTLIIVQGAIRNQGDAWNWMLNNLRRGADELVLNDPAVQPDDDVFQSLISFVAMVGLRLGELHVVLAAKTEDEAFSPVVSGDKEVEAMKKAVSGEVAYAMSKLDEREQNADPAIDLLAKPLLERRSELAELAGTMAESCRHTLMTRTHGDFHLGQILVSEGDAVIIDFEGEPAKNLNERRAKTNPLRDVAGLLRSLSYLVATAQLDNDAVIEHDNEVRREAIARFGRNAEEAFLDAYSQAVSVSKELDMPPDQRRSVLDAFLLEKAAYEIAYEARNRPKWLPIPLSGFTEIVARLTGVTA
ncbi:maltose alpha-D-glucosyltransferase (plasmid) [Rhizobium leguminosarum]|uniref:Maltokinase n=1 Tax=Rhizobium leguminosarum bv. trifolii TaxID=386 RepID=B5LWS6_RHILT|nr:maltose alpha-D-glucosyltransferase [Rhizobium leguminosarum]ACG80387.1 TreS [Rhizobium leguminosarum bv. trifolii]TAX27834.1 maltose alpha-D-glucosyltransferase [Rhizobium leguminosarum]TAX88045.1 maltose alpha-D-glucosyltransferase [Rhizobium leguminosarum]TAY91355.1 maltose alpha-D-glucosyltransferase [Rhizobium leguminosarum]TAZ04820.1 maltose alpha-D-glucosyltransferase [Rhizobium leguminosarum]